MWNRLRMIFRSLFGWMIRGAEDPELILRQYMDDMRDQIPKLNQQAAQIIQVEKMLEEQVNRQRAQVAALQPKVEQAVKLGPQAKEAALSLITSLETTKKELADTETQWEEAKQNSARTLEMRRAYEQKIRTQINEAMRQIGRAKRAQMEDQMASLMASFGVGDQTDTLDRMTERIDERMAAAKAKTTVANDTADAQMAKVDIATANAEAENTYQEYQRQLGLIPDAAPAERTMDTIPLQQTQDAAAPPPQQQAPPTQQQQ
jgi:phage shock protein A